MGLGLEGARGEVDWLLSGFAGWDLDGFWGGGFEGDALAEGGSLAGLGVGFLVVLLTLVLLVAEAEFLRAAGRGLGGSGVVELLRVLR